MMNSSRAHRGLRLQLLTCTSTAILSLVPIWAQSLPGNLPSPAFVQGFDKLYKTRGFRARTPAESRWLDGGERYTVLETPAPDAKSLELVAYETATGKRSVLVTEKQLTPEGATAPIQVEDYAWSADKQSLLFFTNSKKVWRQNTRGDYWVLNLQGSKLTKLGGTAAPSTLMFTQFSPDARSVGYVRENNIYVQDLATGTIRQLTTDGSADIINGTSDWVNEEELDIREAFRWSPDSRSIAYWQFDQSGVSDYTLINDTAANYPQLFHYKYPLVGTTNASVRAGVVSVDGGATHWMKLPGDYRNHYIPRLDWADNSQQVAVEYLNRQQNDDLIFLADAATGEAKPLFEDKDDAYLDVDMSAKIMSHFVWLPASHANTKEKPDLLWLSERDGWRHAYRVSRQTGKLELLTNFPADVIEPVSVDEQHGFFYFTASPSDPIRAYLYRSRLDGKGVPERVTPAADAGTNHYDISENGTYAIHMRQSSTVAPRFDLVRLPEHMVVRTLEENADLAAKVKDTMSAPKEFSETDIGGGVTLSTYMIKPLNFDPSKKYPVLVQIYGEPAGTTVDDTWDQFSALFLQLIARDGYIVLSFDNQGTPAPRGRAWRKAGYGAIGVLSTQQQADAIRSFAKTHPFVDTSRMAMWGWSGGGTNTLNMMFRNPGLYSTGISVAPVPDQTRYDTIYQERYMGLPTENAKGYHDGSAINFAQGLTGNLLLVHGSGDDNVHFQGSELLVNKLIQLGKNFDFMDYPNRTHAINEGQGTTVHVYRLIARYLEEHVPAGARPQQP
ncbi:S9 family peptidase [Granulicella tundricola]|uniref:Peptidase S9B dipeptidylpeptidase IV domain protein n=1 Tax=Granulicella tundricola (strain ATCC BAA-1859 / DSM 23138 / MP5ACTX9) TaxID=1198114 RepID=E8WY87_GRATM|nr:S9 family peptidase [Granulicella tundricola]ADW68714.1 peptidase S9B dipeptidylpeptidase IV domain protein [Granulicella tundricola MP5ACTX9]